MKMDIHCSSCGTPISVPFSKLYDIWKEGWQELSASQKKGDLSFTANTVCTCGKKDYYTSPMFSYAFYLIYEAFSSSGKDI